MSLLDMLKKAKPSKKDNLSSSTKETITLFLAQMDNADSMIRDDAFIKFCDFMELLVDVKTEDVTTVKGCATVAQNDGTHLGQLLESTSKTLASITPIGPVETLVDQTKKLIDEVYKLSVEYVNPNSDTLHAWLLESLQDAIQSTDGTPMSDTKVMGLRHVAKQAVIALAKVDAAIEQTALEQTIENTTPINTVVQSQLISCNSSGPIINPWDYAHENMFATNLPDERRYWFYPVPGKEMEDTVMVSMNAIKDKFEIRIRLTGEAKVIVQGDNKLSMETQSGSALHITNVPATPEPVKQQNATPRNIETPSWQVVEPSRRTPLPDSNTLLSAALRENARISNDQQRIIDQIMAAPASDSPVTFQSLLGITPSAQRVPFNPAVAKNKIKFGDYVSVRRMGGVSGEFAFQLVDGGAWILATGLPALGTPVSSLTATELAMLKARERRYVIAKANRDGAYVQAETRQGRRFIKLTENSEFEEVDLLADI